MVDDAREALRRAAYGRPPVFTDDAAAHAWQADAERARLTLAEPPTAMTEMAVHDPRDDGRRRRRRLLRNAATVAAFAALVAGIAGVAVWQSTPRHPEVPLANRLPAGYLDQHGLTDARNLLNWHHTSVIAARSATVASRDCLILSREGTIEFTCRDGVLEHRIFDTEAADISWNPASGLTLYPQSGGSIHVDSRTPAAP